MMQDWQIDDLVALVRRRYPDWEDCRHPGFMADEIEPKWETAVKAQAQLSRAEMDRLIAAADFDECLARIETIAHDNNLLWRRVPSAGDTAALLHPELDKTSFCTQVRNLLHGDRPTPARLQTFSDYLAAQDLPNGWPLPTYLLFMVHPKAEMLVKPRPAQWFLRYAGKTAVTITAPPEAKLYQLIRDHAHDLLKALAPYEAEDLIDVQSVLWVAHREGRERTGRLDSKGQVELDVPRAEPPAATPAERPTAVREEGAIYDADDLEIPSYKEMLNPVLRALKTLGGAGTIKEINRHVFQIIGLTAQQRAVLHNPEESGMTEVGYRLHWSRSYLKKYGLINNPARGYWELTPQGEQTEQVDAEKVVANYRAYLEEKEEEADVEDLVEEATAESETAVAPVAPQPPIPSSQPPLPLPQLAAATGYAEDDLARWARAIRRKGQAIFYGPPGTGKTFLARQMAQHLAGGGAGEVELVQFHPAYSYEDFMQGIRPRTVGGRLTYEWENGRFLTFCRRAREREGASVFIIDEINRANLAAVFGELMYLLEYRAESIPLAGGKSFQIPAQVYILGAMNTADRSIALVDHALRRRFAFIPLRPNPDVLRHFHAATGFAVESLIRVLRALNEQIGDPHYHVGHTFFLVDDLAAHLPDIWRLEIEPYLEEYFYGQPERVDPYRWAQVKEKVGAET